LDKKVPLTAAEWFALGTRVPYDRRNKRILKLGHALDSLDVVQVFRRVVREGKGGDEGVWTTYLPGFPDGSYVPTLFCSGTRDTFGSPEELGQAASKVPISAVYSLDGADHGFNVLKSSGRTREDVWAEATTCLVGWLKEVHIN